jgi:hypothetical protein
MQKGAGHQRACKGGDMISPTRLAPIAASVKLDASCGFS